MPCPFRFPPQKRSKPNAIFCVLIGMIKVALLAVLLLAPFVAFCDWHDEAWAARMEARRARIEAARDSRWARADARRALWQAKREIQQSTRDAKREARRAAAEARRAAREWARDWNY